MQERVKNMSSLGKKGGSRLWAGRVMEMCQLGIPVWVWKSGMGMQISNHVFLMKSCGFSTTLKLMRGKKGKENSG